MSFMWRYYLSLFCMGFAPSCLLAINEFAVNSPPIFPKESFQDIRLKKGDELHEAALYEQAIDAYQILIKSLKENKEDLDLLNEAQFRLAQTYFSLEDDQNAILILNESSCQRNHSPRSERIQNHSTYLKALSLKNLQQLDSAKHHFLTYAQSSTPSSLNLYEEAIFEIGLIDFEQKNYLDASKAFKSLNVKTTKPRLFVLGQLYLARIARNQGDYKNAKKILEPLNSLLASSDPILYELNYLKGEIAFELHEYRAAVEYFKQALPFEDPEKTKWYAETLYHLGWSYLRIGDDHLKQQTEQSEYLKESEKIFSHLLSIAPNEKASLALAQVYLIQANHLKQPALYAKAEELLSKETIYETPEAKDHALLLRAEAAPTYVIRDKFYRQLTEKTDSSSIFFAKGWYMRALNDFEHAQELKLSQNFSAAQNAFERSSLAFRKSFELLSEKEPQQAAAALKYQALAIGYSNQQESDLQAFQIIESLIENPRLWENIQNKDEIYYLHAFFAGNLSKKNEKEKYLAIASKSFFAANAIPHNTFGDRSLLHLGNLYYQDNDFEKAETIYLQLANDYPCSPLAAEAWLWSACCADSLQKESQIGKERRQYAYHHFPNTPHAAEAYFTYYTYPEYIQGDRAAIKHLQTFTDIYSESPFLIDAHFLIGLDYKRDRKTPEGKWIRKKSLTEAIDAFQKSEILFDELNEKKLIPSEKLDYYTAMRYRATLERAIANLAIADEAQGAKQQIYLEYAEEVFKLLLLDLQHKKNSYIQNLYEENAFPPIAEESSFWLAQTYIKAQQDQKANSILSDMIEQYKKENRTRGYYLARSLDEQGKIAMRSQEYQKALQFFKNAEEAGKGNLLSTDQKLDLWIQQSLCYKGLNQLDEAILILSKVINDDAISGLRIKAMYLRAEIYERQKRPELARKQLESIVKKGGVWAKKAQEKLDKEDFNGY